MLNVAASNYKGQLFLTSVVAAEAKQEAFNVYIALGRKPLTISLSDTAAHQKGHNLIILTFCSGYLLFKKKHKQ